MKISTEDLNILRNAISPLDTEELRSLYRGGNFPNAAACKDKDMRYR